MKSLYPIFLFCIFAFCSSAQPNVDSLLKASSYTLQISPQGGLSGDGASFILARAQNAQFVMIGENHNTREIPQFTTALFKTLHQHSGFSHLALEQDPVTMRIASSVRYKGKKDSLIALVKHYPISFTFTTDEELEMIGSVSAYPAKGNVIWGCDQSFCAAITADKIKNLSGKNAAIDAVVTRIHKEESVRDLDKGLYMNSPGKREDLLTLQKYAGNDPDALFDTRALLISDSIYTLMKSGNVNEGCAAREEYMRSRFLEEYKMSASAGDPMPKAVLKFGTAHVTDGFEFNTSALDLGTFVRQFAATNGKDAFSINVMIFRADSSDWNFDNYEGKEAMHLFTRNASVNNWTLFDLAPLKSWYFNHKMKGILKKDDNDFLEKYVLGFDMQLLIGNGNDGATTICNCNY